MNECFEVSEDDKSLMPACLAELFEVLFSHSDHFWRAILEVEAVQEHGDLKEFFKINGFARRQVSFAHAPCAVSAESDVIRKLKEICNWKLMERNRLVIIDFHTGQSHGETCTTIEHQIRHPRFSPQSLIAYRHFDNALQLNLKCWDKRIKGDGRGGARTLRHHLGHVASPREGFIATIAEMSTESLRQGMELICKRIWVGNMLKRAESPLEKSDIDAIKAKLKERFCPADDSWQQAAVAAGLRSISAAFSCLRDPDWHDG